MHTCVLPSKLAGEVSIEPVKVLSELVEPLPKLFGPPAKLVGPLAKPVDPVATVLTEDTPLEEAATKLEYNGICLGGTEV